MYPASACRAVCLLAPGPALGLPGTCASAREFATCCFATCARDADAHSGARDAPRTRADGAAAQGEPTEALVLRLADTLKAAAAQEEALVLRRGSRAAQMVVLKCMWT